MRIASVVVDVPARALDRPFDYLVPPGCDLSVGHCVLVDFAHRMAVGYVVRVEDAASERELKSIQAVLAGPFFDESSVDIAAWIADEYASPLSEAIRLFTPPGASPRAVREPGTGAWTLRRASVVPVDDRWVEIEPASGYEPPRRATLQRAVVEALAAGPVRVAELRADLGAIDSALSALERAGAVRITKRRRSRTTPSLLREEAPRPAALTQGQRQALAAVETALHSGGGTVLLDGVTGSGKTEVYLRGIEGALALGGSAVVLVPEISLTPQTVGRFRSRFGELVAVLHSRLPAGERLDQWDRIASGDARVVVGARSALFAPLTDLKVVVVDEEHEPSYKQESSPRYHARDVAMRICERRRAVLVLGSASPSMEAQALAERRIAVRVCLPDRVEGRSLPPVTVVDMAAEFTAGNRSMFSRELTRALDEVRLARRKAVLFLNRRGFASFLLCRACGFVPKCASCSTSMTFHEVGSRLVCHHCGAVRPVPSACPACSSPYLRQFGAGTQRVEAELVALFPEWPVIRMDADTTTAKGAHERLLAAFDAEESAVLLGTQMIAKGLDFPRITLVGVMSADVTLNIPDFRAGERAYQLLEQVAGRAGRGADGGRVIIQTYWPTHPAVAAVASHSPELFFGPEREARRILGYPPFGRIANVIVRSRTADVAARACSSACDALRTTLGDGWSVLGPSPAPLNRLKGTWRWHAVVKAPAGAAIGRTVSRILSAVEWPHGSTWVLDVDPVSLM